MIILQGHRGRLRSLAISPDGTKLASAAGKGTAVSLWDLSQPGKRRFLSKHDYRVVALAFAPRGNVLVSLDAAGIAWAWDVAAMRPHSNLRLERANVCLAFAPDRSRLAVGANVYRRGWRYVVNEFNLEGGGGVGSGEMTGEGAVTCLAYAWGGGALAAGSHSKQVHLWDLETRKFRSALDVQHSVGGLAYAPDGTLAAIAGKRVALWQGAHAEPRFLRGHQRIVTGVAFTPDGRYLLTSSTDGTVRRWDMATASVTRSYAWDIGPIHALQVASDGQRAVAGGSPDIVVWDLD